MIHFLSDLHLCPARPEIHQLFEQYLAENAQTAQAIYILGDLFEYWAGDDDLDDPFNVEVCTALRQCAEKTLIHFMPGNRDFLVGEAFSAFSGVRLLTDPQMLVLAGMPTLLMHGDTLCSDDQDYQQFRMMVRNPAWRSDFLARPLAARKAQIEALRQRSQIEKQTKSAEIMDVNEQTVADIFRRHGYPRLIHGHTHRQNAHTYTVDGHSCTRWVLGDWHDSGNYLACDAQGCRFVMLPLP